MWKIGDKNATDWKIKSCVDLKTKRIHFTDCKIGEKVDARCKIGSIANLREKCGCFTITK